MSIALIPLLSRLGVTQPMQEILHGSAWALGLRSVGVGLAFLFNMVLARALGANDAGVFFLALAIVTIVASVARLGLDNVLLRKTAQYTASQQWGAIRLLAIRAVGCTCVLGNILAVGVYFSATWFAQEIFVKPSLAELLQYFAFGVCFLSLYPLAGEMLRGFCCIKPAQFILEVGMPLFSLLFCVFLLGLGPFGGREAVWAYLLAAVCTTLMGWYLVYVTIPISPSPDGNGGERLVTLLTAGTPLLGVMLTDLAMVWMPLLCLGYWGSASDVGVFHIAARTAMLTSLILASVNAILAPKFAVLYQKKDMLALEAIARKCTLLMCLAASPILVVCLLFPEFVLGFFGPSFVEGAQALMIVAIGEMVNVATGSVGYLLMMSGHERIVWLNNLGTLVFNIMLIVWLIPMYGLLGAAWAGAITVAAKNISAAILVRKYVGVLTLPLVSLRSANASIP